MSGKWKRIVLVAVLLCSLVVSESGEAGADGILLRTVRTAALVTSPPIVSLLKRKAKCPSQGCASRNPSWIQGVIQPDEFEEVIGFPSLTKARKQFFEKAEGGKVLSQLFIDKESGRLIRQDVDQFGRRFGQPYFVAESEEANWQLRRYYLRNKWRFDEAVKKARKTGSGQKISLAKERRKVVLRYLGVNSLF